LKKIEASAQTYFEGVCQQSLLPWKISRWCYREKQ